MTLSFNLSRIYDNIALKFRVVTLSLRWRQSKIGLMRFKMIAHRFLMSHAPMSRKQLLRDNMTKIHEIVLTDCR